MKFVFRCVKSLGFYKMGRLGHLPIERKVLSHCLEILYMD